MEETRVTGQAKPVREQRETLETITIVDVDVHVHEDPAQLAEYADPPWDEGLREIAKVEERYLDLPGISPRAEYRVPFPGGSNRRQIAASAKEMRQGLDEPLAAMGAKEGEIILDLIRDLKEQGHSMIVVAHNFIHIVEICDRVNLLQHGTITFDKPTKETSAEELTEIVAAEYRASKTAKQSDTG